MPKEVSIKEEGYSKRTIFPLSEEALMMASQALNDALKTENIDRARTHIGEVFGRPHVDQLARGFFQNRYDGIPIEDGIQNYYAFGATVSLDAIGVQSALDNNPVTTITNDDLIAYKKISSKLVGTRWFTATDDVLASIEKQLALLLSKADNSYRSAAEVVEQKDRKRVALKQNVAFLLGLSDMYFPFRYADERTRVMEVSD